MSEKKKKRKEVENGPVLVFIISLPRNKGWTVIQGLNNWDPLSSLKVRRFLFLEPKLRVTSSLWNMLLSDISNNHVIFHLIANIFFKLWRAYAALYCGPMSSKRMFQQYLRKKNFQQNPNADQNGDHLKRLCRQVLAVAFPAINRSNVYAKL